MKKVGQTERGVCIDTHATRPVEALTYNSSCAGHLKGISDQPLTDVTLSDCLHVYTSSFFGIPYFWELPWIGFFALQIWLAFSHDRFGLRASS